MKILKIFLLIIIFMIPSAIGFAYGGFYKKRRQNLYDLEYCIRLLKSEIRVKNTPLPQALREINSKKKYGMYNVFSQIGMELEKGIEEDLYMNFLSKRKILEDKLLLKEEDLEVFLYLGKILGQSNRDDQDKNLSFIIQQVNELCIHAGIEEEKNKKLYPSLGVLIGIGMIIILL